MSDSNTEVDPFELDEKIAQSFIDKYSDLIEANKSSIPGRPVDVGADMAEAWKWHQDAKAATAAGKLPVLGSFDDVQGFTRGSDYYYRLMSERWSPAINDVWVDSLTESKSPFLLVTPTTSDYLDHDLYGRSVYGTEIDKLRAAGYNVPMDDSNISTKKPKHVKYK